MADPVPAPTVDHEQRKFEPCWHCTDGIDETGQVCGDCCGLGVDSMYWYDEIVRLRAELSVLRAREAQVRELCADEHSENEAITEHHAGNDGAVARSQRPGCAGRHHRKREDRMSDELGRFTGAVGASVTQVLRRTAGDPPTSFEEQARRVYAAEFCSDPDGDGYICGAAVDQWWRIAIGCEHGQWFAHSNGPVDLGNGLRRAIDKAAAAHLNSAGLIPPVPAHTVEENTTVTDPEDRQFVVEFGPGWVEMADGSWRAWPTSTAATPEPSGEWPAGWQQIGHVSDEETP